MPEEEMPLSEREMDIVRLVATGATNRQIARELFISVNTVKVHLRNIYEKLGVASRTEATMHAVRHGWVVVEGVGAEEAPVVEAVDVEEPPERIALWQRLFFVAAAILVLAFVFWPSRPQMAAAPRPTSQFTDRPSITDQPSIRPQESRWTPQAQMPTPRGRLAAVAYGGKIYAIGGDTAAGVTGLVEAYDPVTNSWLSRATKPTAVANVGAAVIGDRIFVPGGFTAGGAASTVLEVYDPISDTWQTGAPLPSPLFAYAIAAVDSRLYVFGGWNGEKYVSSVYEYDPAQDRWNARTSMPTARGFAAAGVIDGQVYVVGGYDGFAEFATCAEYDPAQDDGAGVPWRIRAPMSTGRGGLRAAVVGNSLYAVGGGWQSYLAASERYDPQTNTWSSFETPRVGQWRNLGLAAMEGQIYAIGGWSDEYLSVNERYQAVFRIYLPVGR